MTWRKLWAITLFQTWHLLLIVVIRRESSSKIFLSHGIIIYKTFDTDKIIQSLFRILFSQNWLIALVVIFNLLYLISLPFFIFPFCLPRYWDDGREQELVFYNTPQPGFVASFPQVKHVFKNNCVSDLTSFSQPVIRRCTMSACPLMGVYSCCPLEMVDFDKFPFCKSNSFPL